MQGWPGQGQVNFLRIRGDPCSFSHYLLQSRPSGFWEMFALPSNLENVADISAIEITDTIKYLTINFFFFFWHAPALTLWLREGKEPSLRANHPGVIKTSIITLGSF